MSLCRDIPVENVRLIIDTPNLLPFISDYLSRVLQSKAVDDAFNVERLETQSDVFCLIQSMFSCCKLHNPLSVNKTEVDEAEHYSIQQCCTHNIPLLSVLLLRKFILMMKAPHHYLLNAIVLFCTRLTSAYESPLVATVEGQKAIADVITVLSNRLTSPSLAEAEVDTLRILVSLGKHAVKCVAESDCLPNAVKCARTMLAAFEANPTALAWKVCCLLHVLSRACMYGSAISPCGMPNAVASVFAREGGMETLLKYWQILRELTSAADETVVGEETAKIDDEEVAETRLRHARAMDAVCSAICLLLKRCVFIGFWTRFANW
jgi:hypothetical protein